MTCEFEAVEFISAEEAMSSLGCKGGNQCQMFWAGTPLPGMPLSFTSVQLRVLFVYVVCTVPDRETGNNFSEFSIFNWGTVH